MPIYAATAQQTREAFDQGVAPGYFCPPQDPKFDDEALKSLALAYVRNLKIFAEFLGKSELLKMLEQIKSVACRKVLILRIVKTSLRTPSMRRSRSG